MSPELPRAEVRRRIGEEDIEEEEEDAPTELITSNLDFVGCITNQQVPHSVHNQYFHLVFYKHRTSYEVGHFCINCY